MNQTDSKPVENRDQALGKKRRKEVSARIKAKRFQEFELKSAATGEAEARVSSSWLDFYNGILGETEALQAQSAMAKGSRDNVECMILGKLGFDSSVIRRLKRRTGALFELFQDGLCRLVLLSSHALRLDAPLKDALDREASLGRCVTNSSAGSYFALRELFAQKDDFASTRSRVFLDTCADGTTKYAALQTDVALCMLPPGRAVPLFDHPSTLWIRALADVEGMVRAQRVLCRVPSTRDGAFASHKIWRKWRPNHASDVRAAQVRSVMDSVEMLDKGGLLVYFTQSMNPAENEEVVQHLLEISGGGLRLERLECRLEASFELASIRADHHAYFTRVHPHAKEANGKGFFYCVLRKCNEVVEWLGQPDSLDLSVAKDYLLQTGQLAILPARNDLSEELKVHQSLTTGFEVLLGSDSTLVATKAAAELGQRVPRAVRYGMLVTETTDSGYALNEEATSILPTIITPFAEVQGQEARECWEAAQVEGYLYLKKLPKAEQQVNGIALIRFSFGAVEQAESEQQGKRRLSVAARRKLKKMGAKSGQEAQSAGEDEDSCIPSQACYMIVRVCGDTEDRYQVMNIPSIPNLL